VQFVSEPQIPSIVRSASRSVQCSNPALYGLTEEEIRILLEHAVQKI